MYTVCVHVRVVPGKEEAFLSATLPNARATRQEPGNLRFDVLRSRGEPDRFLLYEVYRDEAGMAAHKETTHYVQWRDEVAGWMAEPRQGVKYDLLDPCTPSA
jgi:autoinducer 2-degrading protein